MLTEYNEMAKVFTSPLKMYAEIGFRHIVMLLYIVVVI